jgi:hypothetical protein
MLSKADIQVLERMFEKNNATIRTDMQGMFVKNNALLKGELKREIRDEMHSLIKASEAGLIRRMDDMETRLLDSMSSMVGDTLVPQLDDHEHRLVRLERTPYSV